MYCNLQLHIEICPLLQREKDGGICIEECSNDDDCSEGKMCCSNGCGHQCTIPYTVRPNLGESENRYTFIHLYTRECATVYP